MSRSAPTIAGLSGHFHDAAAALLIDGRLVAAAQEERFSRLKHDPSTPRAAFGFCLAEAGLSLTDLDALAWYENPVKKLDRQLWMGLPALPSLAPEALFRLDAMRPEREIREQLGWEGRIEFVDHHEAHAASAYYFSGFPEAAVLTVDAVGEWATTSYATGAGDRLQLMEEVRFPDSLGLLYSTLTAYLGFDVNDAEYKVMGLAPYGEPRFVEHVSALIHDAGGGQFRLDLRYFDFLRGSRMYSEDLCRLFGRPPRPLGAAPDQFAADVARSLQVVLEEILLAKVRYLHARVPSEHLCLAGGVALNCVAVGRIVREGPFRRVFVQPAASDAGGALGAAALAHVRLTGRRPDPGPLRHVFLGPAWEADEIARLFESSAAGVEDFRGREAALLDAVADRLAAGRVVGWFQGRMEFGPRALGNRSILADPRDATMRDRVNALVKKREAFRPFAPAVLEAHASLHFELDHPAPFMLETCRVRSPLALPAITHVDGSARVQTVDAETNPRFHRLLEAFERRTGCPILLNTSFNLRGEAIVCSPADALLCFLRSGLDTLVLGDHLLDRAGLPPSWTRWFGEPGAAAAAVPDSVYTLL
ncbi:MAG TPA: carbamoyltransferase C-terminal domain-containing protein [Methylomirabilota bacterium]|jgi:carbamoyltransferase|nr:carbamoyltransferase C-terminal domain-containing protein [Methylomirabilota bacterium]